MKMALTIHSEEKTLLSIAVQYTLRSSSTNKNKVSKQRKRGTDYATRNLKVLGKPENKYGNSSPRNA